MYTTSLCFHFCANSRLCLQDCIQVLDIESKLEPCSRTALTELDISRYVTHMTLLIILTYFSPPSSESSPQQAAQWLARLVQTAFQPWQVLHPTDSRYMELNNNIDIYKSTSAWSTSSSKDTIKPALCFGPGETLGRSSFLVMELSA